MSINESTSCSQSIPANTGIQPTPRQTDVLNEGEKLTQISTEAFKIHTELHDSTHAFHVNINDKDFFVAFVILGTNSDVAKKIEMLMGELGLNGSFLQLTEGKEGDKVELMWTNAPELVQALTPFEKGRVEVAQTHLTLEQFLKGSVITFSSNDTAMTNVKNTLFKLTDMNSSTHLLPPSFRSKLLERPVALQMITDAHKEKRMLSPISCQALRSHAELHLAIRKSKIIANQMTGMKSTTDTVNNVFNISGISYFKIGSGSDATQELEKLMYDCALLMGVEQYFVATETSNIYFKKAADFGFLDDHQSNMGTSGLLHLSAFGKKNHRGELLWTDSGELVPTRQQSVQSDLQFKKYKVSIQQEQTGITLEKWLETKSTIPLSEDDLNKVVIINFLFSPFDLHTGNIFITPEGTFKLFDNARSLPHSNGFIDRSKHLLRSPFRSSLLDMTEANQILTSGQKKELKLLIDNFRTKMPNLTNYLNSKCVQNTIASLPENWLNVDLALKAMNERLTRMEAAINSDKVLTLTDFAFEVLPEYRFIVALEIIIRLANGRSAEQLLNDPKSLNLHNNIGFLSINETVQTLSRHLFDVEAIHNHCSANDLSYCELIEFCAGVVTENKKINAPYKKARDDLSSLEVKGKELLQEREDLAREIRKNTLTLNRLLKEAERLKEKVLSIDAGCNKVIEEMSSLKENDPKFLRRQAFLTQKDKERNQLITKGHSTAEQGRAVKKELKALRVKHSVVENNIAVNPAKISRAQILYQKLNSQNMNAQRTSFQKAAKLLNQLKAKANKDYKELGPNS